MYIPKNNANKTAAGRRNSNIIEFPLAKNTGQLESVREEPETPVTETALVKPFPDNETGGQLPVPFRPYEDAKLQTKDKTNGFRVDELRECQIEKYSENFRLIFLMERENLSPAEAKKRTGAERSERAIAYLYERYKESGKEAIPDKRWRRKTKETVMTTYMKRLILNIYMAFPVPGPRGLRRLIAKEIARIASSENNEAALDTPLMNLPAVSTIHKFLTGLPEAVKLARTARGYREFQKQGAPYMRYENTSYANERWQVDHSELAIWIRVRRKGKWIAIKIYITLALDVHSRAIAGFWLSTKYPDT
jgi:hypothetical protein